jgi:hypothetical protein
MSDQLAAHDVDQLRADCGATTRAWAGLIVERATLRDALLDSTDPTLDRALVARLSQLADLIDQADRRRVDADAIERAAMHARGLFHPRGLTVASTEFDQDHEETRMRALLSPLTDADRRRIRKNRGHR